MNKNNLNINFKSYSDIFIKEPFTKREAWNWLIHNAAQKNSSQQIQTTLRLLTQEWKWPKTKVSRFLTELTSAKLIIRESSVFSTTIKFPQTLNDTLLAALDPDQNQIGIESETKNGTAQSKESSNFKANAETLNGTEVGTDLYKNAFLKEKIDQLRQDRNNSGTEVGTGNGTTQLEQNNGLKEINGTESGTEGRTITGQIQNGYEFVSEEKEEKKKRSKKRKEEITKEKYSLKGIQKERYEQKKSLEPIEQELPVNFIQAITENQASDHSKSAKKTIEQIEIRDIAVWAADNIPDSINLEWELAKFQDYYRANSKKLPKDAVAAFRNWLRNAIEFKTQNYLGGKQNAGHNSYEYGNRFKQTTGIERFLTGGIRAITKLEKR